MVRNIITFVKREWLVLTIFAALFALLVYGYATPRPYEHNFMEPRLGDMTMPVPPK